MKRTLITIAFTLLAACISHAQTSIKEQLKDVAGQVEDALFNEEDGAYVKAKKEIQKEISTIDTDEITETLESWSGTVKKFFKENETVNDISDTMSSSYETVKESRFVKKTGRYTSAFFESVKEGWGAFTGHMKQKIQENEDLE